MMGFRMDICMPWGGVLAGSDPRRLGPGELLKMVDVPGERALSGVPKRYKEHQQRESSSCLTKHDILAKERMRHL